MRKGQIYVIEFAVLWLQERCLSPTIKTVNKSSGSGLSLVADKLVIQATSAEK